MTPDPTRILLVEDNRADAVLLQDMLLRDTRGQFEFSWTSSLRETLDRIECEPERFDAVLLDLSLPDSHGLNTIKRLCSAVPAMPILVITGLTDEHVASEAVRCGAEDYLVKGQTDARSMVRAIRYAIDRRRSQAALLEAKAAAEAASAAKSQFLANISHELRTPMNAILGMIDLAAQKATDPTAADFLKTAKESADLLLALLDDLLDCAKIEAGKLELESAPFSLARMLDQLTRVLSVRASEKGLAFSCRIPDGTPDGLVGDQVRLRQILFNLAGNAIKFTQRGLVEVSVRTLPSPTARGVGSEGQCLPSPAGRGELAQLPESPHPSSLLDLEFTVRDTGIGIPPADVERIFQPFAQADASTTRRFGGTGLGLSICSSLVALMGGRIWVESEVGKGSTFHFTVRLSLAKEFRAAPEPAAKVSAVAASALRILLAEDNPANQKLAAYILRNRGHEVEIAGDGRQSLRMSEETRYDVILLDVQMPGMDGLEAAQAIRTRENGQDRVPIIAMTAHAMKGDRERCLAAGMDAYLSKPINGQEMIALVESLTAASPAAAAGAAGAWARKRHTAEQRLQAGQAPAASTESETDARALFHELQVHQIELELQNGELLRHRRRPIVPAAQISRRRRLAPAPGPRRSHSIPTWRSRGAATSQTCCGKWLPISSARWTAWFRNYDRHCNVTTWWKSAGWGTA